MEDNYLDKKFREILENPPQMEPPESAIEDMRNRLTGEGERKKRGMVLPIWWPFLLTILFVLGSFLFFQKYQSLNQKFDALNLQLTEIQNDTLINKTIVYQFDTIVNTIYKDVIIERRYEKAAGFTENERRNNAVFSSNNFNLFGKKSYGNSEQNRYQAFSNWRNVSGFSPQKIGLTNPNNPLLPKEYEDIFEISKDVAAIDFLDLKYLKMGEIDQDLIDKLNDAKPSSKKPKKNLIYCFQPVGASVGIHATPYLSANLPDGFVPGRSFGINAELHFIKNVHLRLGIERLSMNFELKDAAIGNRYPIANPDDPLDVLHELKANLSYLQIPIELKKGFRDGKFFQPYLHVGFSAVGPLTQKFTYEYINAGGEYKTAQSLKNGVFSINNLRAGFGGDFSFGKKYKAGLEMYYQHGLEMGEGEYFKLRYWGVQASLQYQLF